MHFMNCFRLRDGLKVVLIISKLGNQYIQANKPWVLVKGNEDDRYGLVIFQYINIWWNGVTFYLTFRGFSPLLVALGC